MASANTEPCPGPSTGECAICQIGHICPLGHGKNDIPNTMAEQIRALERKLRK